MLTETAENNLDRIAGYVEGLDSAYSATQTIKRIRAKISTLDYFPKRKMVSGYEGRLWMIHIKKYVILYTVDDRRRIVKIIHILAAKQDYTRFLNNFS